MERFYFDPNFRRSPKTDCYCAVCQKDLIPNQINWQLGVVAKTGFCEAIATADLSNIEGIDDIMMLPVGNECARKIPGDYLVPFVGK